MRLIQGTAVLSISLLTLALSINTAAQNESDSAREAFQTIDGIINTLYKSVSFEAGGEPDWDLLRSMLFTDAIFVMRTSRSSPMQKFSTDEFIDLFKRDITTYNMRETGFNERVTGYTADTFSRLTHAFVVYEVRLRPEDEQPLQRGVDSIQLVHNEGRWWIASITNDIETPDNPIPERFLKGGGTPN